MMMRRKPEYGRLGARWRGGSVEPVGAGSKRRGACRPKRSLAGAVLVIGSGGVYHACTYSMVIVGRERRVVV